MLIYGFVGQTKYRKGFFELKKKCHTNGGISFLLKSTTGVTTKSPENKQKVKKIQDVLKCFDKIS